MKSTFGGLNTVVRGLFAQQTSLDTVGHNISNSNTEGYSRQGVNLSTTRPEIVYGANGENQTGTGVNIQSVTRARDVFLDRQMWKETSTLGYGEAVNTALSKIEEIFHEPSDNGVQTTLNNFWTAWQNLATNASDNGMRTVVRQRGVEVVNAIQQATQQLVDMAADTNSVIKIKVDNVNEINSEICSLNKQIVVVETGGDHANDLRDRRDLLVDKLSKLMNISINEDALGNYNIQSGNLTLVDGRSYRELGYVTTTDQDYGYPVTNVVEKGKTVPLDFRGGELQGLVDSRDSVDNGVKGYLNQLNTISQFLLTDFNAQHLAGYGADNSTGNNFFGNATTYYTNDITDLTTVQATYGGMAKVFGEKVTGSVQGVDYDKPKASNTWINQLQVNPAMFTTSPNGLDKIAAKTSISNPASNYVALVTKSDTTSGNLTITSNYTGATQQSINIKITGIAPIVPPAVASTGEVTSLQYTINGGAPVTVSSFTGTPPSFSINIGGSQTTITMGTASANSINDTYQFTLGQGSYVSNIVQSHTTGGNATISSNYTGTTGQNVQTRIAAVSSGAVTSLEYLENGVWKVANPLYDATATANPSGFSFSLPNGSVVQMKVAANTNNTVGDVYSFSVGQGNASGDNSVNMANRLKTKTSSLLGDSSLDTYYNSLISSLGVKVQSSKQLFENQTTLVNQVENWRQSVSGVNVDEEMSNMIRFQKGYNAAARVLTSMDEMLDKLINGTGVVGR